MANGPKAFGSDITDHPTNRYGYNSLAKHRRSKPDDPDTLTQEQRAYRRRFKGSEDDYVRIIDINGNYPDMLYRR